MPKTKEIKPLKYTTLDIIAALQAYAEGRNISGKPARIIFNAAIKELRKGIKLQDAYKKAVRKGIKAIPKYDLMPAQAAERKTTLRECLQAVDEVDLLGEK